MLIDRLVGIENYNKHTEGKPCVVVISYGRKGWEGYSRAASLVMPLLLRMKLIDCWQVHAALPGESLLDQNNMNYARSLGVNMFCGSSYPSGTKVCPRCGSDLFRLLLTDRIECPICGAQGILKSGNIPNVSNSEYYRYGPQEMEEHFREWLREMKLKFPKERDKLSVIRKIYEHKNWWIKPESKT